MARFFVRIELHEATPVQYDQLHKAMAGHSFTRFPGMHKKYPDASYTGPGPDNLKAEDLSKALGKALKGIKIKSSILVVKYNEESDLATYELEPE